MANFIRSSLRVCLVAGVSVAVTLAVNSKMASSAAASHRQSLDTNCTPLVPAGVPQGVHAGIHVRVIQFSEDPVLDRDSGQKPHGYDSYVLRLMITNTTSRPWYLAVGYLQLQDMATATVYDAAGIFNFHENLGDQTLGAGQSIGGTREYIVPKGHHYSLLWTYDSMTPNINIHLPYPVPVIPFTPPA